MRPAFLTRFLTRMANEPKTTKIDEFIGIASEEINDAASIGNNFTVVRYHGLTQAEVDHVVKCIRRKGYCVETKNFNNMRISW